MPVCTSCNIEYEEDKKFCNYCGSPLTPKAEPMAPPRKVNRADEEKSDGKLICPKCKITYEFGSSCIQCGSPLGRQTSFQEKEEPETARRTDPEEKLPPVETSQQQKSESALVPETSVQTNGAPETSSGSEVEGKPLQVQTMEEQLVAEIVVEKPRKKLICPSCKIIYERGTSCVRCGAAIVPQTSSSDKEEPKSSDTEFNPPPSEPDGLEDDFFQRVLTEPSGASGRGPGSGPERSSPSSPERQNLDATERGKKREPRVTSTLELEFDEELPQARTPEQPVAKKLADDLDKRVTLLSKLSKLKKDYRRVCIEVGSIIIMVVAGGYLLWSVYSYLTKPKQPEPRAPISKVAVQTLPSSSSSPPSAIAVAEPGESKNTEGSSSVSKETAPSSLPDIPKTPSIQTQEIGSIKNLLENVRQSNLKKDIDLFVSCYASDFENMEGRKRATIAYWERFSYLDLSYDLKNLSLSAETAKARVEWLIKTSSRGGGQSQQNKSILNVTFRKEEGQWKIKEVKPVR